MSLFSCFEYRSLFYVRLFMSIFDDLFKGGFYIYCLFPHLIRLITLVLVWINNQGIVFCNTSLQHHLSTLFDVSLFQLFYLKPIISSPSNFHTKICWEKTGGKLLKDLLYCKQNQWFVVELAIYLFFFSRAYIFLVILWWVLQMARKHSWLVHFTTALVGSPSTCVVCHFGGWRAAGIWCL